MVLADTGETAGRIHGRTSAGMGALVVAHTLNARQPFYGPAEARMRRSERLSGGALHDGRSKLHASYCGRSAFTPEPVLGLSLWLVVGTLQSRCERAKTIGSVVRQS